GDMGAHVARQPDTPDPLIVIRNPADYVRSEITGMIIDKNHLPIEILARKCLGHRFIERHDVICFVEGGDDEAEKHRPVRVSRGLRARLRWNGYRLMQEGRSVNTSLKGFAGSVRHDGVASQRTTESAARDCPYNSLRSVRRM